MNGSAPRVEGRSVRVYLLDDHEIVRRGVRDVLGSEDGFTIVGESDSALEATRQIPLLRPDVAILDGRLPDGSGIDVCRAVHAQDPSIRSIILTSYDDDDALVAAIMAGASGYVLKQVRGSDLVDIVRRVASGRPSLDPSVTARVLDRVRARQAGNGERNALTQQEERVLALIGQGMTNRQIAREMYLAEKTVKNYVSSLLSKLGISSRTQAAIFSLRNPPPSP